MPRKPAAVRQPPYDPEKDWKIVIPWVDRDGRAREFESYGPARCFVEGTIAAEIMAVLHAASLTLVGLHPEAAGQKGDVKIYHPALKHAESERP